ncbi:hypothetical protein ABW19_dt0201246 [Dactylella cylindrospora]|nr:hypothetical protein ABW19_dt0201246 [Dactylella cylindrospora]
MLAVDQFDGANAKGQPIRVKIAPQQGGGGGRRGGPGGGSGPANEGRSLFERVSGQPQEPEGEDNGRRDPRRQRRDIEEMRQNAKELGIDRYIPGDRNGSRDRRPRRGGMGGERERRRDGRGGRQGGGGGGEKSGGPNRPRKTAEELDAEMNDYWTTSGGDAQIQAGGNGAPPPAVPAQSSAIELDDDL